MHVVYACRYNSDGKKTHEVRRVFWSIAEAQTFCQELTRDGYTQDEHGAGWSRWSC